MVKTNKQIQADYRARMRNSGFVLIHEWVHKDDRTKVKKYIETLNRKRER